MAWEYLQLTFGTNQDIRTELNNLGSIGWEVVGLTGVDKTIGLNSITVIMKRHFPDLPPPVEAATAAWCADPLGRHPLRWWDGQRWTENVSDEAGKTSWNFPVQTPKT